MMQTDVKQAHLNQSGQMIIGRARVKAIAFVGTANTGQFILFDTTTAPVITGTYGRSGTTVTVTQTAHGLVTGQVIGIDYNNGTGGSPTPGNFAVTRVDANTFTVTDINSGTITGAANCQYTTGRWLMTFDISAGDTYNNSQLLPGEGVLALDGVYMYGANITAVSIFYG